MTMLGPLWLWNFHRRPETRARDGGRQGGRPKTQDVALHCLASTQAFPLYVLEEEETKEEQSRGGGAPSLPWQTSVDALLRRLACLPPLPRPPGYLGILPFGC